MIEWREKLSVGDKEMDNDHKRILKLINTYEAAIAEKNIFDLKLVFENLIKYTEEHFVREEEFMARLFYPEVKEHAEHHAKLKVELEKFHQNLMSKNKIDLPKTSDFLNKWLIDHIIAEDLKFKKYIDENNL